MNGFIILDKDSGIFSRKACFRVAKLFNEKKFGHIGTLDEMASGVLPIAIGNATKMIPFIENVCSNKKEYLFGLKFGFETDSLDTNGKITHESNIIPKEKDIINAINIISKTTTQIPPTFSAIHIEGKRAYELARTGKNIKMPPRPITIYELEYFFEKNGEFNFRVVCSRGTYVRSIVRDIAKLCQSFATTTYIRRIYTNGFDIKNSVKLDFLENLVNNNRNIKEYLISPDYALGDIPVINLDRTSAEFYKHGGFVDTDKESGIVRVYCDDCFIGIGHIKDGKLCPKRTL